MTAKTSTPRGAPVATNRQRRSLLQGMGGIAAASLGAAVVHTDAAAQALTAQSAPTPATAPTGYRLTEHIRAYYSTTRL